MATHATCNDNGVGQYAFPRHGPGRYLGMWPKSGGNYRRYRMVARFEASDFYHRDRTRNTEGHGEGKNGASRVALLAGTGWRLAGDPCRTVVVPAHPDGGWAVLLRGSLCSSFCLRGENFLLAADRKPPVGHGFGHGGQQRRSVGQQMCKSNRACRHVRATRCGMCWNSSHGQARIWR